MEISAIFFSRRKIGIFLALSWRSSQGTVVITIFQYQWVSTRSMALVSMFLCNQSYASHGRDFLLGATILYFNIPDGKQTEDKTLEFRIVAQSRKSRP